MGKSKSPARRRSPSSTRGPPHLTRSGRGATPGKSGAQVSRGREEIRLNNYKTQKKKVPKSYSLPGVGWRLVVHFGSPPVVGRVPELPLRHPRKEDGAPRDVEGRSEGTYTGGAQGRLRTSPTHPKILVDTLWALSPPQFRGFLGQGRTRPLREGGNGGKILGEPQIPTRTGGGRAPAQVPNHLCLLGSEARDVCARTPRVPTCDLRLLGSPRRPSRNPVGPTSVEARRLRLRSGRTLGGGWGDAGALGAQKGRGAPVAAGDLWAAAGEARGRRATPIKLWPGTAPRAA